MGARVSESPRLLARPVANRVVGTISIAYRMNVKTCVPPIAFSLIEGTQAKATHWALDMPNMSDKHFLLSIKRGNSGTVHHRNC